MSFASLEYLPFLCAVLAVFQFLPARARVGALVCASVLFYAWRTPSHLYVLASSAAIGFAGGLALERAQTSLARRTLLAAVVLGEIGLLVLGKSEVWAQTSMPIGVSFYTLQHIGYVVDVYRGQVPACRAPLRYALFGSFFPLLHAGPIERAPHFLPQLDRLVPLTAENFSIGARRILWGLAKKSVLADRLLAAVAGVFADPSAYAAPTVLLASLCMLAVLYADFSAYTDIARGSARLFGVELVVNFRRPLIARSVPDFIGRWHISLVAWITDYVYSPLFGARPSHWMLWRANLVAMMVFGLWHGGSWKFVFVGLTYGTILSVHHSIQLARARRGVRAARGKPSLAASVLGWTTTTLLACTFIVFFFARDLAHAGLVLGRIVGCAERSGAGPTVELALPAAMLLGAFALHASGEWIDWDAVWRRRHRAVRVVYVVALAAAVVVLAARETSPFLYFQF